MNAGLRTGLAGLRYGLRRLLFCPGEAETAPARLRGSMRSVIVVPAPDALFSEAVFILRPDAAGETGLSRRELLKQAEQAAARYTAELLPARRSVLRPSAAFLLGASAAVLLLWLTGVI